MARPTIEISEDAAGAVAGDGPDPAATPFLIRPRALIDAVPVPSA